jgi:hypothetical protein
MAQHIAQSIWVSKQGSPGIPKIVKFKIRKNYNKHFAFMNFENPLYFSEKIVLK